MLATFVERFLLAPWRRIALEAADERRASGFDAGKIDWRVPGALVLVALIAVFQWYMGDRDFFAAVFKKRYGNAYYYELGSYAWWTGAKLVGYILVPLVVLLLARVRLSEANTSARGVAKHLPTYALLYALVLPVVYLASRTHAFQTTYPFYKLAGRSWTDLLAWELLYASSFIALELFYRGFVLGMLRRSLGPYAIFVMIVPYCMVHFGKPAIESVGAIFAGIALGTLAMATRSIWGGVLIHVSIAWTMDLLAILQTTGLPGTNAAGRFVGH
jgi:membrane protease YdiL (CAAX protease family)